MFCADERWLQNQNSRSDPFGLNDFCSNINMMQLSIRMHSFEKIGHFPGESPSLYVSHSCSPFLSLSLVSTPFLLAVRLFPLSHLHSSFLSFLPPFVLPLTFQSFSHLLFSVNDSLCFPCSLLLTASITLLLKKQKITSFPIQVSHTACAKC